MAIAGIEIPPSITDALGIILWEALLRYHPFDNSRPAAVDTVIFDRLKSLVELESSLGNPYFLPLFNIKRPHQFCIRVSEKLETLLFKTIRLQLDEDGKINDHPGFESLAQFKEELLALINEAQYQPLIL